MKGRVLIVAGSDSGGGAGIQADIKTVTMLDAFAATAITAVTAQNTEGVHGVLPIDPRFIRQQMEAVLDDIGADAIKTGMLHDGGVIDTVAAVLAEKASDVPLVLDPVMVAKGGAPLIEPQAIDALKRLLVPRAAVLTPNLPEAEILVGKPIADLDAMRAAARELLALGCRTVLLKGGHLAGDTVHDILATALGIKQWTSPRIHSRHTHGTGCTLASAIAAGLAQGMPIDAAAERARCYVQQAIANAPGFGRGHGPLDHAHPLWTDSRTAVEKSA
ncbi:MAG: bifunctional hydroxymethylpyrimidine kinase/phosphomethylpyrimidine kinase [Alphaproteobacteria bacterium]|nr:bifunctional hydroxymethylpyrimidine kinase/phosphomethylpyrimidine kinase [Alphaproteobacteria bacterium]